LILRRRRRSLRHDHGGTANRGCHGSRLGLDGGPTDDGDAAGYDCPYRQANPGASHELAAGHYWPQMLVCFLRP
jgi:hypothetical protein